MRSSGAGVTIGEILGGKYRIEKVLGVGGMGAVFAASHLGLDQKVAIKLMLPELLSNEEAVGRFLREGRAAAKIKNDHVVRVFDVDSLPNGAPYIVMELLEGRDLADLLRDRGALPIPEAVDLVLQTCEVVSEAHALGIVHRDLKPANLFCVDTGDGSVSVKVLDFGISKLTEMRVGTGLGITNTASMMGSPLYMSPEQMHSARDVDGRTDIWALGVILYQLLTGQTPFTGSTPLEIGVRIATTVAPLLRALMPDAPAALESAVRRCLERDPRARFADVREFASALAEFAPPRSRPSLERIARQRAADSTGNHRAAVAPTTDPSPGAPNAGAQGVGAPTPTLTAIAAPSGAVVIATKISAQASTRSSAPPSIASSAPAWGTTLPPKKKKHTATFAFVLVGIAVAGFGAVLTLRGRAGNRGAISSDDVPGTATPAPAKEPSSREMGAAPLAAPTVPAEPSPMASASSLATDPAPPSAESPPESAPLPNGPAALPRNDRLIPARKAKPIAKTVPLVLPSMSAQNPPDSTTPKRTIWEDRK